MIAIVDYGVGNIAAFLNIFKELGIDCFVAKTNDDLVKATKLILPGVGHFDFAMQKLENSGMIETLNQQVLINKIPILGICVGMQMMANESEEGTSKGLEWISAKVKMIDTSKLNQNTLLPHMGWNSIHIKKDSYLFKNFQEQEDFYFLHSYFMNCEEKKHVLATVNYGEEIAVVVQKDNIYGMQCHPEKSHQIGVKFLENFANL
ncbi:MULTISPECIES: imidazole glycerol phosphate synthase subunit HisH [Empedobacter]|uniref:imidazole glycerol phosphate synthase subunit HisH n=1 Tax=Empedobacter TaxID=59734 RepID=UPI00056F3150|nr:MULTISPECIES: imidazole glycerol phosphate synthase subunit HisH [Empedobacter]